MNLTVKLQVVGCVTGNYLQEHSKMAFLPVGDNIRHLKSFAKVMSSPK
uniref:Uncharacterized protein n=1 Tax=Anguilla anguilla TaxID=7936 RepID=A0A0E9X8J3_ANGAN